MRSSAPKRRLPWRKLAVATVLLGVLVYRWHAVSVANANVVDRLCKLAVVGNNAEELVRRAQLQGIVVEYSKSAPDGDTVGVPFDKAQTAGFLGASVKVGPYLGLSCIVRFDNRRITHVKTSWVQLPGEPY